jgi:hypothetical protein
MRFPSHCWRVEINTSPSNVREEALWRANVAISLMRFLHPEPPPCGAREAYPNLPWDSRDPGIGISGRKALPRSSHVKARFVIGQDVIDHFAKIDLSKTMVAILDAKASSVGARIAQGLGWLARGRQESRSERLLCIFTAVEALLSSDDTTAPISQTISRHAATMLSNDPVERSLIAKEIRTLYGLRSKLVHGGHREIADTHAGRIQELAERLYRAVLREVEPARDFSKFSDQLSEASYGLPWPR